MLSSTLAGCGQDDVSNHSQENGQAAAQQSGSEPLPVLSASGNILILGDRLATETTLSGSDGDDALFATFRSAEIRMPTLTGFEVLNLVFEAPATFDGSKTEGLTTINLGLGEDGLARDMSVDVDLNAMDSSFRQLNIHASLIDLEVDYAADADADLTINFPTTSAPVTIGDRGLFPIYAVEVLNVAHLTVRQEGEFDATIFSDFNVTETVRTITVETHGTGGLELIRDYRSVFHNGQSVEHFLIDAQNGDVTLAFRDRVLDDARSLQSIHVMADNADVELGVFGNVVPATELETYIVELTNGGTLLQSPIRAHDGQDGADIALISITASSKNSVGGFFPFSFDIEGILANSVGQLVLNAADGGNILLNGQVNTVYEQVYTGSGNIEVTAGFMPGVGGFTQAKPADASQHAGSRTYKDSAGDDTFYGSSEADFLQFQGSGNDVYFDAGGDDFVRLGGLDLKTIYDGDAGTDDHYVTFQNRASYLIKTGSGNDIVDLDLVVDAVVDFGTWQNGFVEIRNWSGGTTEKLSFIGLGGEITATAVKPLLAPAQTVNGVDDNAIYVIADGDAVVGGSNIADYTNISDVAQYLSILTQGGGVEGDAAVFVINNGSRTFATGDTAHSYIYFYNDVAHPGVQASDLTLIASVSTNMPGIVTAVNGGDIL